MSRISHPRSVRISGVGGQGNILMGIILADALLEEKYWVVQTQSYGAQVRGGLSYCDVLFCKEPIDYPKAKTFDVIYCMHQIAANTHAPLLKMNGVLILDTSYIVSVPKEAIRHTRKIVRKPITSLTESKFGSSLPANMVGLGMISKAASFVSLAALKSSMKKHLKPKHHEMNEKALEYGYSLVERSYKLKEERKDIVIGRGFE